MNMSFVEIWSEGWDSHVTHLMTTDGQNAWQVEYKGDFADALIRLGNLMKHNAHPDRTADQGVDHNSEGLA